MGICNDGPVGRGAVYSNGGTEGTGDERVQPAEVQSDVKLFTAMAKLMAWRTFDVKHHRFANTAWAFATMVQSDEQLCAAMARP